MTPHAALQRLARDLKAGQDAAARRAALGLSPTVYVLTTPDVAEALLAERVSDGLRQPETGKFLTDGDLGSRQTVPGSTPGQADSLSLGVLEAERERAKGNGTSASEVSGGFSAANAGPPSFAVRLVGQLMARLRTTLQSAGVL